MKIIRNGLTNENGIALPLVLILVVIMTLFSITAMNIAQGNTNIVSRFLGSEKALYAAEQGYNQYLWKLNNDSAFYTDTTKYNCAPESDIFIYTPKDNSADEANNFRVQIRVPLDPDSTEPVSNRVIIRSTGWNSKNSRQQRTIEVELLCRSFTQYAMISNKEETSDGDKVIWYSGDTVYGPIHTNDTFYLDNSFVDYTGNAIFWDLVTYGNEIQVTGVNLESKQNVLNNPDIFKKGHIRLEREVKFPGNAALNELRVLAKADGHYYNGRTCIYLKGDTYDVRYYDRNTNSWYYNGQRYRLFPRQVPLLDLSERAKILSEWLKEESSDRVLYQALDDNDQPIPGRDYNSFAAFKNSCPDSLALPDNRVIYVDGSTGYGTCDFGSLINGKFQPNMANIFVSGNLSGSLTIASANDIYITGHDPTDWKHPYHIKNFNNDSTPGLSYATTSYNNQNFSNGQWLSTDVQGNDMLGLIANRNVHTIHWNWPSQISHKDAILGKDKFGYNWGRRTLLMSDLNNLITKDTAPDNITIHAAVFAVRGSFGYETNFAGLENLENSIKGFWSVFPGLEKFASKGTMTVFGSVGQNIREHTKKPPRFNNLFSFDLVPGYKTEYTHDPRMINDMPPHFISPANSGWYSNHWEEVNTHVPE